MRRPLVKALLWQLLGLLFYLGGMLLFLFVAVNVFLSPPENSLENLASGHMLWMLVSIMLLVTGRAITWKFGAEGRFSKGLPGAINGPPEEQSTLRRLGYNVTPDSSDDQQVAYEDGTVYVICGECGTRNEQGYSYCSNCSSELPE